MRFNSNLGENRFTTRLGYYPDNKDSNPWIANNNDIVNY
jgi:hypothetical protein